MMKSTKFYIALGSNKGDKFKNLQSAVDAIYNDIGHITKISRVYNSQAFGFEGDDFLNCCLALSSRLQPQKVLDKLLEIETELGRVRSAGAGYEARTIDLDIVFAEDHVVNTE